MHQELMLFLLMLNSIELIKVVKIENSANAQWHNCDINNYFHEGKKTLVI